MPLSIGTPLTSTVIWRPSQPPHPPDRPPPEWAALPPTAPVQVLRYLGRPQGEWPPALVVTEAAEGPLPLRQGPPAVDAARLPQEELAHLPPGEVEHLPCRWQPVPREDDPGKVKKSHADADAGVAEEDVLHAPTRRPWTPPGGSTQGSPQAPLNQADLQRRLRMLLQDQQQIAAGRRIANITTTNSIVTSYKEGGRPSMQSNSSRFSP